MNDIFDFRRFGKYFAADCKRILHTDWPAIVILSFFGVLVYAFALSWNWIFFQDSPYLDATVRSLIFGMATCALCLYIPSRCYGHVTDRRKGAAFAMLPASVPEKVLSMLLNCLAVIPAVYIIVYLGSDALLCSIDKSCGESIITHKFIEFSELDTIGISKSDILTSMVFNLPLGILTFLLGALVFKKHKISKTVLALLVCSVAIGLSSSAVIVPSVIERTSETVNWLIKAERAADILLVLALMVAIYFRVKTIKY